MQKLLTIILIISVAAAAAGAMWFLMLSEDATPQPAQQPSADTPAQAKKGTAMQANRVQEPRYIATVTAKVPHIALADFKRALLMHRDWRCEPNPEAINPGVDRLPVTFTLNLPKKQFMAMQGELKHLGMLKMTTETRWLPRPTTYVEVRVTLE